MTKARATAVVALASTAAVWLRRTGWRPVPSTVVRPVDGPPYAPQNEVGAWYVHAEVGAGEKAQA